MEFGYVCDDGLGISESATALIVDTSVDVWVATIALQADTATGGDGSCLDADGATGASDDTAGTTARSDLTAAVLQNAPSLSNHNDATAGATTLDLGQRGHGLNESGYGSWPYIVSVNLNDDNLVEYGSDSVNVCLLYTSDAADE